MSNAYNEKHKLLKKQQGWDFVSLWLQIWLCIIIMYNETRIYHMSFVGN